MPEKIFPCACCKKPNLVTNDEDMCPDCADDHLNCFECRTILHDEHAKWFEHTEQYLCEDCFTKAWMKVGPQTVVNFLEEVRELITSMGHGRKTAERLAELLQMADLKPISQQHEEIFAIMDAANLPRELRPFVVSGVLDHSPTDKKDEVCFTLPEHQTITDIITLTWYAKPENPSEPFELTISRYRDKNCSDPLGSEDLLGGGASLDDLIDYLENLPD